MYRAMNVLSVGCCCLFYSVFYSLWVLLELAGTRCCFFVNFFLNKSLAGSRLYRDLVVSFFPMKHWNTLFHHHHVTSSLSLSSWTRDKTKIMLNMKNSPSFFPSSPSSSQTQKIIIIVIRFSHGKHKWKLSVVAGGLWVKSSSFFTISFFENKIQGQKIKYEMKLKTNNKAERDKVKKNLEFKKEKLEIKRKLYNFIVGQCVVRRFELDKFVDYFSRWTNFFSSIISVVNCFICNWMY